MSTLRLGGPYSLCTITASGWFGFAYTPPGYPEYTYEVVGLPQRAMQKFLLASLLGLDPTGALSECLTVRQRVYRNGFPAFCFDRSWHVLIGEPDDTLRWPTPVPFKTALTFKRGVDKILHNVDGRGRPPGPYGFTDGQEFEDTLISLIQAAHAKGQSTKKDHIAALLRPVIDNRRGNSGSVASVNVNIESTKRLITKHTSCTWRELVNKALHPL